ncbi:MAG: T9SS type A sorting domain-containing protein [Bacteroidota bacterium]|nr:T9SS type A sorting domain-containing protein [Bacteroidota bacterium]
MKKFLLFFVLAGLLSVYAKDYRIVTVKEIQTVHPDSLKIADSLGVGVTPRWLLQASTMYRINTTQRETVSVIALVTVPAKVITYTALGNTLCITDTGVTASDPYSGIFVRYSGGNAAADAAGLFTIEQGDIIKITGIIDEFPSGAMESATQFTPIAGIKIEILSSGNPLPAPVKLSVSDFNIGNNPGGKVKFTTGEKWEGMRVMFTNVRVGAIVNSSRGTWQFVDENGNTLSDYDWSYHFTVDTTSVDRVGNPHDLNYKVPLLGTPIDTLIGYIGAVSGQESNRGYRISPIYPGDVVYGKTLPPSVTTHRRNPIIVDNDSTPTISAKIYRQNDPILKTGSITTAGVVYRVGNGAWQEIPMVSHPSDSTYLVQIPKQVVGSTVSYFIRVTDSVGSVVHLSNSSVLTQFDTSKGFFFYTVLDRDAQKILLPSDVQRTPFNNGRTPYLGAIDSVGGIVTVDTSALRVSALSAGGPSGYYIQSGNTPWSGLWVVGPDSIMRKIKIGDSVIVTGSISEFNDVTELFNITSARVVSSGNPLPAFVKLKTERFGDAASNGNLNAEPYEGMLVQFDSVEVKSIDPVFSDATEYSISNSNQSMLVRRDGKNKYSNVIADTGIGLTVVKVGDKFASMAGVLHYSFGRYKIVPRTNADFVGFSPVLGVQITRNNVLPGEYSLEQNYPNPFNPSTTFSYSLKNAGTVLLKVYNVIGQEVATLVNEYQTSGTYSVKFDASKLSTGMYLYRISSGNFVQVKKMLLVK